LRAITPLFLQIIKELKSEIGIDIRQGEVGGFPATGFPDEEEQEAERVSIGDNSLAAGVFLIHEIDAKEVLKNFGESGDIYGVVHFGPP
jgi:hypothetical protein